MCACLCLCTRHTILKHCIPFSKMGYTTRFTSLFQFKFSIHFIKRVCVYSNMRRSNSPLILAHNPKHSVWCALLYGLPFFCFGLWWMCVCVSYTAGMIFVLSITVVQILVFEFNDLFRCQFHFQSTLWLPIKK